MANPRGRAGTKARNLVVTPKGREILKLVDAGRYKFARSRGKGRNRGRAAAAG